MEALERSLASKKKGVGFGSRAGGGSKDLKDFIDDNEEDVSEEDPGEDLEDFKPPSPKPGPKASKGKDLSLIHI